MAWIVDALSALLDWLAVAFCYTLAAVLVVSVIVLVVMLQVEQYKEERRETSGKYGSSSR